MFGQEPDGAFFPAIAEGLHGEEVRRDPVGEGQRGFAVTAKDAFNRLRVMVVKKSADLLRN